MKKGCFIYIVVFALFIAVFPYHSVNAADNNVSAFKIKWLASSTHKTIKPGKNFTLKAKVLPADASQKMEFSSSKPSIAKVNSKGVVAGKKKGAAIITATAKGTDISAKYYVHVGKRVKKVNWKNAKKKKTMYAGKKFDFNTSITPVDAAYKKVKYTSSKPSVANVSKKGIVKAKKNGKTTISAKAMDGSGKKVVCKITVKTRAKSVTLNATSQTCFVGKKLTLKKKVLPADTTNKTVKYKTSNKKIATVSKKGVVKGRKKGTVTITATTVDGSKKKTKYKVYVRPALDSSKSWFTAHRGYSAKYPENSVQSFTAATKNDFKGIETDIHEVDGFWPDAADDEDMMEAFKKSIDFVVMHDQTLLRTCGANIKVKSLKSESIDAYHITGGNGNDKSTTYKVPLLYDYLDTVSASDKYLIIEIKDSDISAQAAQKLIEEIDKRGVANRTYLCSFEKKTLLTVRSLISGRSDIKTTRFLTSTSKGRFQEEINWCATNGINEVTFNKTYITPAIIKSVKTKGMSIGAYTVDDAGLAADLLAMGVDHITTNKVLW